MIYTPLVVAEDCVAKINKKDVYNSILCIHYPRCTVSFFKNFY